MRTDFLLKRLHSISYVVCLLAIGMLLSHTVVAGELDDFEQDVTKPQPAPNPPQNQTEEDDDEDGFWDMFASIFWHGIFFGGINSWARVQPDQTELAMIQPRELGAALIPFVRLDAAYQQVESDLAAYDLRAEAGYGPLGGQIRFTQYNEQEPSDELQIIQVHGLYRMSFGNHVELDLGIGATTLNGDHRNTGFSMTLPILIHPIEQFGIEFRPAWATINNNPLNDYDLGIILNYSYAALRAGYRWMHSENEALDGVYFGVSFKL